MKKFIWIVLPLIVLTSCEMASTTGFLYEQEVYEYGSTISFSSNKRDSCHNSDTLHINAMLDHQVQGDVEKGGYFDGDNPFSVLTH